MSQYSPFLPPPHFPPCCYKPSVDVLFYPRREKSSPILRNWRDTACSASIWEAEPRYGSSETGKEGGGVLPSQQPVLSVSPRRGVNGIKMWPKRCKTAEAWLESPLTKKEKEVLMLCNSTEVNSAIALCPGCAWKQFYMHLQTILSAGLSTSGKY